MAYQQDYLEDYIPDLSGYNGLAILIGMDYSTTDKLDTLQGTQVDMIRLGETFSFLKFAVLKLENLAKHELIARLSFITHNKITCNRLVVVFSGHGKMGELYVQDGKSIKTDEFFDHFSPAKTGTRIADVQLFFVDTCRGDAVDHGTIASRGGIPKEKRHPCIDNVLIAYSTTPQHKAYECKGKGGLWLSLLAGELELSNKAITEVLVDVNCHLRNKCQRKGTAFQTAEFTSYLTENIYLRKEALLSIPKLDVTVKSYDVAEKPSYQFTSLPPSSQKALLGSSRHKANLHHTGTLCEENSLSSTTMQARQSSQPLYDQTNHHRKEAKVCVNNFPPRVAGANPRSKDVNIPGVYKERKRFKQQLKEYCCSPELRHGKKYKYLRNFPIGSLVPLYLTVIDPKQGKPISAVVIVPLHLGYVKGDWCSTRQEAEETAAKAMLDKLREN